MTNAYKISLREKSGLLVKGLQLIDCVSVALLLWTIMFVYQLQWSEAYTYLSVISFMFCFFSFHYFQLYRSWRGKDFLFEFTLILKAWATVIGILLFFFFLTKLSIRFSRVVLIAWFTLVPLMISLVHLILRKALRVLRAKGFNIKNAVIVGANRLGIALAKQIEEMPWAGIHVLGFFDDSHSIQHFMRSKKQLLGNIADLQNFLSVNLVDYVYIALPLKDEKKIHCIIQSNRTFGAQLLLVPDIYSFSLLNAEISSIGNMIVLDFNPDLQLKRYFDVLVSFLVLLLTLPITILVSLFIKLADGGPIFYFQNRIMAAGRTFRCIKFRTMVVGADKMLAKILESNPQANAEWKRSFKLKKDPRVTKIGRILRKISLDELPQFINVLKGDMSIVGARPIVQKELHDYYKEDGGIYCSIKPGITGIWQVSKRSDAEEYEERIQLDTWYVLNRTFWLDLKIIFKTVACLFTRGGAY